MQLRLSEEQALLSDLDALSTAKLGSGTTGLRPIRWEYAGVAIEHLIQARLIAKGYCVSTPSIDSGYDLIVDWKGVLNRLQIRSSSHAQRNKDSKTSYYRIKANAAGIGNWSVLAVFIVTEDVLYLIPWDVVKDVHTLAIPIGKPSKFDEYKENYNILQTTH
jgi:hypothetical protein